MNRASIGALTIAAFVLANCGEANDTQHSARWGIERFGLSESAADYPLVMSAIKSANAILPQFERRFAPGWGSVPPPAAIPVYAVRGRLGPGEIMATYVECGCVVVQAAALEAWLKAKVGSGSALLPVQPRLILSYMLLHEAGHFAKDGGIPDGRSEPTQPAAVYNREPTAQKEREAAADAYAAVALKSGLQEGRDRGLAAADVAMALSQLSWNLSAHRLLDDFGGSALRKPSLFWDAGTSHPNLEWRILVVNDLVASTEASRQLLADFDKARGTGPDTILWQRTE